MNTMLVAYPPLSKVAAQLEAIRTPSLSQLENRLIAIQNFLTARDVASEITPDAHQAWSADHPVVYPCQVNGEMVNDLCKKLVEEMSKQFPINDYWMEEMLGESDDGQIPFIPIQPVNLVTNWDDFDEMLTDPTNTGPDLSVAFLCFLISYSVTDEDAWWKAANHFDWPEELQSPSEAAKNKYYLDDEKLLDALTAAGMQEFFAPFKMSVFDTNSVFLDLDDNQVMEQPIEFSAQAVRTLVNEWAVAEKVLDENRLAAKRAQENPTLYLDFMRIIESALVLRTGKTEAKDDNDDDADNDGDTDGVTE